VRFKSVDILAVLIKVSSVVSDQSLSHEGGHNFPFTVGPNQ